MAISVSNNALPASGSISFSQIRGLSDNPTSGSVSLSNYYRNGSNVPNANANTNLPTSGTIKLSNFRGVISKIVATITGTEQNLNTSSIFGTDYGNNIKKVAKIDGYVISQNLDPALTVNSGSPSAVELQFASGGVFGSRGAANSGTY